MDDLLLFEWLILITNFHVRKCYGFFEVWSLLQRKGCLICPSVDECAGVGIYLVFHMLTWCEQLWCNLNWQLYVLLSSKKYYSIILFSCLYYARRMRLWMHSCEVPLALSWALTFQAWFMCINVCQSKNEFVYISWSLIKYVNVGNFLGRK